ncbi:DNA helicase [Tanacetum coccineum]
MLLCHQKGCKSLDEVRTYVNAQMLPTFRAACEALGLLGDEKEWDMALEESTALATSKEIRILFAQILIYCNVADPNTQRPDECTKRFVWRKNDRIRRICTLKENMRLQRSGLTNEENKRSESFAKWLLNVGDGKIKEPKEDQDSSWITIPPEYSVDNDETSLSKLINLIYDDTTLKIPTAGSL